jgi:branched-chain amino acid transport system permease protein
MLGGLSLGVLESVAPTLLLDGFGVPTPNQLKDVVAFSVLVLVLIFRPYGLLGRPESK